MNEKEDWRFKPVDHKSHFSSELIETGERLLPNIEQRIEQNPDDPEVMAFMADLFRQSFTAALYSGVELKKEGRFKPDERQRQLLAELLAD